MTTAEYETRKNAVERLMKNEPTLTNVEMGKKLGMSERSVRRYKTALREGIVKETSQEAISNIRCKRLCAELKNRCNSLEKALEQKDSEIRNLAAIATYKRPVDIKISSPDKREVVPVIVASDWHIEESVSAAITNGLNEYNLQIAEQSIQQFFNNACYLIERTKLECKVNTVVVAILGDIINGVLRDEDIENNQTTSVDAITMSRSFLYSGIKLLAKTTGCNIKVICCVGNHGRMTERIHFSTEVHNSLEYLMYKILERDFRDYKNVDFVVSEAQYTIQNIFGLRVRFQHGHTIKFHGGIGGLAVPVLRKVAQLNTIEKADLDVIGHFHSFQCLNNVIVNGSLVGTNAYSMALGLPHEPPQQTFFLIDSKYGKSMITPIFIDRSITKTCVADI